jgi:transcriptional regulatory protein RtcR
VVIGFMGTQLDSGQGAGRWSKWRPTVSLMQHEDQVIDRLELLYSSRYDKLAQTLVQDIANVSPETRVNLVDSDVQDPWDFGEMYASLYDWARNYRFDTERENYWVHITTGTHVAQICMFLMVESRQIPGVLLQTSPPRKQQMGSPGNMILIDLDLTRYEALAQRFHQAQTEALDFLKNGIATRNPQFNQLIEEIERVAIRSRAPILFTGPTGAGKSHLARRIFELKKSRHQVAGDFVEVNCATLRGDGAASTLFGHRKGAFTGAAADRAGLLRTAHEGVLFLDEIGELGLDEQAMLLKAVEEKRFFPMGSDKEVSSDFQLIAGTHRDLRVDVAEGAFAKTCLRVSISGPIPCRAWHSAPKIWSPISTTCCCAPWPRPAAPCASTPRPGRCICSSPSLPRLLERQLPRPCGQHHAAGHAGRQRSHHDQAGGGRDQAPGLAVAACAEPCPAQG